MVYDYNRSKVYGTYDERRATVEELQETLLSLERLAADSQDRLHISLGRISNQAITAVTMTKIQFNKAKTGRQVEAWNSTLNRFVAPRDGIYHLDANIVTTNATQYTPGELYLYRNGIQERRLVKRSTPNFVSLELQTNLALELSKGEYVELFLFVGEDLSIGTHAYMSITQLA